jgi:hypothetical protein
VSNPDREKMIAAAKAGDWLNPQSLNPDRAFEAGWNARAERQRVSQDAPTRERVARALQEAGTARKMNVGPPFDELEEPVREAWLSYADVAIEAAALPASSPTPEAGVMHEIDRAFYDLTVRERDYERRKCDRLAAEVERLRAAASPTPEKIERGWVVYTCANYHRFAVDAREDSSVRCAVCGTSTAAAAARNPEGEE